MDFACTGREATHGRLITLESLAVDILDNQWQIEKQSGMKGNS